MATTTDLVVPKLGESISEAIIGKWLKQVGEPVQADEPVVDLETDKVTVALNAPATGILHEQKFATGATVKIGDVVGSIAPGPEISIKPKADAAQPPPPPSSKEEPRIVSHGPTAVAAAPAPVAVAPVPAENGHPQMPGPVPSAGPDFLRSPH